MKSDLLWTQIVSINLSEYFSYLNILWSQFVQNVTVQELTIVSILDTVNSFRLLIYSDEL